MRCPAHALEMEHTMAQPFDDRDGKIWFNGKLQDWRDSKLHVLSHGLHYASAVFEGERSYNGRIFKMEEHHERLIKSARILGFELPYSREEIDAAALAVLEANDIVDVGTGAPYGADPSIAPQRGAGYAVALNTATGESEPIAGMGRLNHENTIALPDWNKIVLLTTDDTFSGPSAQLYMYLANNQDSLFADTGSLWAFRVTETDEGKINKLDAFNDANDYLDLQPGDNWQGEFIRVPQKVARGNTDLAPQQALEDWSNENNVFQFIRLEDLAYDKNDPSIVYVADTGRTRVIPDEETGRMKRGPGGTVGQADNGRVFKFVIDDANPRKVVGFSIVADADVDPGSDVYVPFTNPDNMDTSANSLMIQEDTDDAKIWRQDLGSGTWSVVATVNDSDGESSGIVDVSEWFGAGSWILDVQGHGEFIDEFQDGDVLRKRESGQLLLMHIPGS